MPSRQAGRLPDWHGGEMLWWQARRLPDWQAGRLPYYHGGEAPWWQAGRLPYCHGRAGAAPADRWSGGRPGRE